MTSGTGIWENLEAKNEKSRAGQGGFQSMGLMRPLLSAVFKMNYNVPTPIQRRAIPVLLQNNDVVAMARTGSGKTAAYLIPLFNKLKCEHSNIVGIKSIILSPTRELALQIMRVAKKLSWLAAAAAKEQNLCTDKESQILKPYNGFLRIIALVGGTSIEAQFTSISTNPDIVVASPGRLLHLMEEASIKLTSVNTIIMDEADRLFELGLQPQIVQLMQKIPDQYVQKCLFSATMPSILAEFANAGLHSPVTIRLDTEMKISENLKIFTFITRTEEKNAALIFLLKKVIKVRTMDASEILRLQNERSSFEEDDMEEERGDTSRNGKTCGPQAMVFVESKHHVELLEKIFQAYSISCAAVHGQLDQEARKIAVQGFSRRIISVLIVTDVAARGIDIPLLDHVINFSFPFNPKLFVHRVGRVARASRSGCAFSLLTNDELPYYIDLMSFLTYPVRCVQSEQQHKLNLENSSADNEEADGFGFLQSESGYYGRIPQQDLDPEQNYLIKLRETDPEIENAMKVAENAHRKYERTKKKASSASLREVYEKKRKNVKLAHLISTKESAGAENIETALIDGTDYYHTPIHPFFIRTRMSKDTLMADAAKAKLRCFKSGKEGGGVLDLLAGEILFHVPEYLSTDNTQNKGSESEQSAKTPTPALKMSLKDLMLQRAKTRKDSVLESQPNLLQDGAISVKKGVIFHDSLENKPQSKFLDAEYFLPNEQKNTINDQHYTVKDATIDISPESAEDASKQRAVYAWNKKKNKYTKVDYNDAAALTKGVKNEAGKQIDFKKGKLELYSKWMKKTNMRIQDCGEEEDSGIVTRATHLTKTGTIADEDDDEQNISTNVPEKIIQPISRSKKFNPQDIKDKDAFGNLRKKGIIEKSKRAARKEKALQGKKNNNYLSAERDLLKSAEPPKLKIGRKLKKLPKDGSIRSFDDLISRKKAKEAQRRKEGKKRR